MQGDNILKNVKQIHIPSFEDTRGSLTALEFEKVIPFPVRRLFFVKNVQQGNVRGEHAHKNCHQFFMVLNGSVDLLLDDGKEKTTLHMNANGYGVHVPPMVWSSQFNHSNDAIFLVLASESYSAEDYIHAYDEFMEKIQIADSQVLN
jgi:dTDP-4-dehydrorhamnose 3,5-epimerase-like enzyme